MTCSLTAGGVLGILAPLGPGPGAVIASIARFLTVVDAYWIAAGLALFLFVVRRRPGMLNTLLMVAIVWLLLRGLGAALRLVIPCIAPNAESAFGFVVAVSLGYLLPLRLWQRALSLSIVALMAATRAYTLRCQVPGELALAAALLLLGAGLLWLLSHWQLTRQLWQRAALALDNWAARSARTRLTPPLQAVLAARLRQHLGFTVESMQPVGADGVHASTPVVLTGHTATGERRRYFVKLVSRQNWQSSVIYEGLRWLQYRGRLRSGPLWPSLKALVEYEHYMLLLFTDLGVPVPRPRGIYRLERHTYALVSDYLEGVQSLRDYGEVSSEFVRRALTALRRLRDADCAHRDIKASNLVILPGEAFVFVDLALAEYVAGAKRLARDLADMLVVLAMHHDPQAVVTIARDVIGARELRRAASYLHRSLVNDETQKMLPQGLPRQLRELVARETKAPRAAGRNRPGAPH